MLDTGQDLDDDLVAGDLVALGIEDFLADGTVQAGLQLVDNRRLDLDDSLAAGDFLGVIEHAPLFEMGLGGCHQADMTVDTGAAIPAGVRLGGVVNAHGDDVAAGLQVRGQVIGETGVAVRPGTQVVSVDPDRTVHVHTVEFDGVVLVLAVAGDIERLPVPADTHREIADGAGAGIAFLDLSLNAPVVGQVKLAPGTVIETG